MIQYNSWPVVTLIVASMGSPNRPTPTHHGIPHITWHASPLTGHASLYPARSALSSTHTHTWSSAHVRVHCVVRWQCHDIQTPWSRYRLTPALTCWIGEVHNCNLPPRCDLPWVLSRHTKRKEISRSSSRPIYIHSNRVICKPMRTELYQTQQISQVSCVLIDCSLK